MRQTYKSYHGEPSQRLQNTEIIKECLLDYSLEQGRQT